MERRRGGGGGQAGGRRALHLNHGAAAPPSQTLPLLQANGVYVAFEKTMTSLHATTVASIAQQCTMGVWLLKKDPDLQTEVQKLVKLGVRYVNTDLPENWWKGASRRAGDPSELSCGVVGAGTTTKVGSPSPPGASAGMSNRDVSHSTYARPFVFS